MKSKPLVRALDCLLPPRLVGWGWRTVWRLRRAWAWRRSAPLRNRQLTWARAMARTVPGTAFLDFSYADSRAASPGCQCVENVGDHIQALASRRFFGDGGAMAVDRATLRLPGAAPRRLVANAWWYFWEGNRHPSEGLVPLPVAVHLVQPKRMPAEALDWLRRFAPVGCRDWRTLRFLLRRGVPAYFSGCCTLTLLPGGGRPSEVLFCDTPPVAKRGATWDLSAWPRGLRRRVSPFLRAYVAYRVTEMTALVPSPDFAKAEEQLRRYASAALVVTTRIHCALPCLAMGVPTILICPRYDRSRFEGLVSLLNVIVTDRRGLRFVSVATDRQGRVRNPTDFRRYAAWLTRVLAAFGGTESADDAL